MALLGVWSRLQGVLIGAAVGRAASTAFRPIFELAEQDAWKLNPNRVLNLNQLAQLVAQAIVPADAAAGEAERSGYQRNRLDALVQLEMNGPGLGSLQEMLRRGEIDEAKFRHGLRKMGVEPQYDEAALALVEYLAPPTDLVRFGVREVFNPQQRNDLDLDAEFPTAILQHSRKLGISDETMRNYWAAHWELPSYGQLSQMLFRGELTQVQFRNALKALDYAPTWRAKLETIARAIPTITDFQRLVRRGIYAGNERQRFGYDAEYPAEFTEKMALHGMSEDDARDLWAGGWRLPSARQLYVMLWRGEITESDLNIGLKALDYPVFYRQKLANIARPKPGRTDLRLLQRHGIITPAQAHAGYMAIGYSSQDADREVELATAMAANSTGEGDYVSRAQSRLWTVTHNEYVQHSLTKARARAAFVRIGVPPAQRETILDLWDVERDLTRKEYTASQVLKYYKRTNLTREDAFDRLIDLRYTPDDANRMLDSES